MQPKQKKRRSHDMIPNKENIILEVADKSTKGHHVL